MSFSITEIRTMASLLTDKTNEFAKLQRIDQMTCLQILGDDPKAINYWVDHIAQDYLRRDPSFSAKKLKSEIKSFQKFLKGHDDDAEQFGQRSDYNDIK